MDRVNSLVPITLNNALWLVISVAICILKKPLTNSMNTKILSTRIKKNVSKFNKKTSFAILNKPRSWISHLKEGKCSYDKLNVFRLVKGWSRIRVFRPHPECIYAVCSSTSYVRKPPPRCRYRRLSELRRRPKELRLELWSGNVFFSK